MTQLFLSTALLGLAFSATPGSVNAESFRRGMASGFWSALLVQLGSLVGDMVWAALALWGATLLAHNRDMQLILGVIGACFLLRLAVTALQQARRDTVQQSPGPPSRGDFITGTLFSLTNPFALAFWLGMGAGVTTTAHGGAASFLVFLAGFFCGAALWCLCSAWAIAHGRQYISPVMLRWINALCGAVLGYFGLSMLWRTLRTLRVLRLVRVFVG